MVCHKYEKKEQTAEEWTNWNRINNVHLVCTLDAKINNK